MSRRSVGAVLVLAMLVGQGVAAPAAMAHKQEGGKTILYGAGAQTCGQWTQDRSKDGFARQLEIAWIEGFVSGAEGVSSSRFSKSDAGGMTGYVDNYCSLHPLDKIAGAAIELTAELVEK